MGLDIYLHTAADAAANAAHDEASNAFYGRPDYEQLSKDERKAIRDAMPPYVTHADVPSTRYPDHLFNRRYLRSSYNNGGFNHAVPQLLQTSGEKEYPHERGSLYWIFEPMGREWDGDEGDLTPDDIPKLRKARERAQTVAYELATSDRLQVTTISPNAFSGPSSITDDEALAMYRAELPLRHDDWYSKGPSLNVFGDGLTVLAAVPGKATLGEPGVHLIYRTADEGYASYVQSAEIVVEFCDEAISLIERDGGCSMSWSG
jgi:hypothetical protein